jgi:uncharacterized membrane protein
MEHIRRAKSQCFVLLCALAAAGIAIYLTTVHYQLAPLACSESGFVNCARVLDSTYAVIPGTTVPISIPGIAWAVVMAALVIAELRRPATHPPNGLLLAQFAWALIGMLAVLYLVYVEIVRLHNLCAWCTTMHALIFLMFLVTLARLTSSEPEIDATEASEPESARVGSTSDRR